MTGSAPPTPFDPVCLQCALPLPRARRRAAAADPAAAFCCFGCRLAHALARPAAEAGGSGPGAGAPQGTMLLRLGAGVFLSMNIMVLSGPFYARAWFGEVAAFPPAYGALETLFAYLLMFLTTLVLALLGAPLAADALACGLRPDTTLLIGVGVGSAYALSVAHVLAGDGALYFDTAAMILVLVTLGNYLEAGARRRAAAAAGALLLELPAVVAVRRGAAVETIEASGLVIGDLFRARPGEAFAADGMVADGESQTDEAILTGESAPRRIAPGDRVLAGAVNLDGLIWVRAAAVGADRVIRRIEAMLEEARRRQPPMQRLADRIAAWFVPGVVLLAALVFARDALAGSAAQGLFGALSVLLIACPCALGLAAPLATWSALRRAAAHGILIDSAATLERAARIDHVFFDKTGTLTESRPALVRIDVASAAIAEDEALRLAAAVDATSLHPIARALADAAAARGLAVPIATRARALPGEGVEAEVEGRRFSLGGARLATRCGVVVPGDGALTRVHLIDDAGLVATLHFGERVRAEASSAVAALRRLGAGVEALSGDRAGPSERVAGGLGIPIAAGLLPGEKLARLEAARRAGPARRRPPVIAMVGDGINDAPILAAADVGFAMGSAADLARRAGPIHLIHDRLDRVPLTIALARHAVGRVRLNLLWAFGYNGIGLTLAACGLLTPIFAASTMIVSSLVIIALSKGAGRVDARALGLATPDAAPEVR